MLFVRYYLKIINTSWYLFVGTLKLFLVVTSKDITLNLCTYTGL